MSEANLKILKRQVEPRAVEALEEALALAKAGEIFGVAIIADKGTSTRT